MKQKHTRKCCFRLGVFTAWFRGHYQLELISGIEEAARQQNVQVVYFSGRSLHSPHAYENDHNLVYDTALNALLDGLIIFSVLADYCTETQLTEFLARYKHIPVITINCRSSIGNAILTHNKPGFSALMQHLTEVHGYGKIAFIKGPEQNLDAIERFAIYGSALSAKGIPFDPALVTNGNFSYRSGQEAARMYLDKRGLKPGRDIEVVVCANDTMACGLIDELYDRGLRIPADLAVTGFDNMDESIFPKPPLTTVRQHLHAIGHRAVHNLLNYQPHQEPLFFDTELVIRNSCGCTRLQTQPQTETNTGFPVYNKDLEFIFYENITIIDNLKILQKIPEFTAWMHSNLPILGINSAWLFLHAEVSSGARTYKRIAGYDLQEPDGQEPENEIPENKIFDALLSRRQNCSFGMFPLLFKEEKYGLLAIEVNMMAILVYDALSHHIGSSIKNMLLGAEVAAMNRQLRQSNEQKTQFFINVAHETKTPLTLIQNYMALYLEQYKPDKKLLVIKQNIDILLENMLNFLDVEKLQKGETIYRHDSLVDLAESARRKCALFQALAAKKQIRITLSTENNIVIRIDPWALDRIFNNLLDNAVKYTQAGGRIVLAVLSAEGKAVLRVSDNGPGLPADTSAHIFEPYYLLSQKKTGRQGMGVGLAIVKKIIDSLGADITVEKRTGGGTCFTITFTDSSAAAERVTLKEIPATVPPSPPAADNVKEKNITPDKQALLVVDDNIPLLEFIRTAFENAYNVFLARDVQEALFKLKTIPRPDLIISDIMMEGPDGFQLLTTLATLDGYTDIPFIFLTALGGATQKLRGLGLGAVDYIEKPFSIAELRAKIESIIALRRRQAIQDVAHFRSRIEGVFTGLEKSTLTPAKPEFESLCEKYGITGREQDIVRMLMGGLVHKEIASRLNIAPRTVEYYITKIYKKFGVNNKFDLLNKFQG